MTKNNINKLLLAIDLINKGEIENPQELLNKAVGVENDGQN